MFLDRTIFWRLAKLSAPIIGLNMLSVISLAIDTAMCGRLEDSEHALEGLGFATQVVFIGMVAMLGLVVGTVAVVSRYHGAGKSDQVDHVVQQSTYLTGFVGIFVAAIGYVGAEPLIRALGADGESVAHAIDYLRPSLTFCVFPYLLMMYAAVLRGVGNTRLPFMIGLLTNILNVIFNYALILGNWGAPSLGVNGAAIGTVTSQAIGVVVFIVLLSRGVDGVRLPLRPAPLDRDLAKMFFQIGAPAALDMVILNASFVSILGMLGQIDGTAVAAHGIGLRIQALAFVPGLSVSQATGAMVGNALGAGDVSQARAIVRAALVLCTGIMTSLALLIIAGAEPIVQIFDVQSGTPLMRYSIQWMQLLGAGMPIVGIHIAIIGMLRGSGETKTSLMINVVGTAVQIPLSWILGFPLGLATAGVWAGFPLSFLVKGVIGVRAYRKGKWAKVGTART